MSPKSGGPRTRVGSQGHRREVGCNIADYPPPPPQRIKHVDDRRVIIGRIELKRIARARRGVRSFPEIRFETKGVRSGKGRIKNVSPGGLFVLTSEIPLVEEPVHLAFQDDTLVWIDLLGTVLWTRPEENESGGAGFGAAISAAPDNYKAYVQRLAARLKLGEPDGAP